MGIGSWKTFGAHKQSKMIPIGYTLQPELRDRLNLSQTSLTSGACRLSDRMIRIFSIATYVSGLISGSSSTVHSG